MKQDLNPPMERVVQPLLWIGKVPYLPHYTKKHHWVSPGKGPQTVKTTTELMALDAKLDMTPLWPRHWTRLLNLVQ